ncbi:MAG TPA: HdeA/HdeB family chaperone [Pseudolabrys sp.]|nr:HdeA/HdeB family chaperone [Pseudolabrys sp.]
MTIIKYAIKCALLAIIAATPAFAQTNVSLQKYTCGEFLADLKDPANGEKLLRSLMMISWATGYAAAFQTGAPRGDPAAINLIAAALGDTCHTKPDQRAISAIVDTLKRFADDAPTVAVRQLPPLPPGSSRWSQGGSIVSLSADGAVRKFVMELPEADHEKAGIRKGAILFSGSKNSTRYEGKAYKYSTNCPALPYEVFGEISADEKQVTLRGKTPRTNAKCQVTGYDETSTVYTFIPPQAN